MAADGESVEAGYLQLARQAMNRMMYDDVLRIGNKLGEEGKEKVYEKLRLSFLKNDYINASGQSLMFSSINEDRSIQGLVRKLGLTERLEAEISQNNETSLKMLHKWLGVE